MSALDALLNNVSKTSGNSNSTNLVVTVDQWEENQVKGTRMDTGEQVVVRLSKFEKKPDASFDRPDLKTIKEKKRCGKGAIICFENAYLNSEDGAWYSRWANLIRKSENDKKTVAAILKSKVIIGKSQAGKEYVEIKSLSARYGQPVTHQTISSLKELSEIASSHLVPVGNGVVPYLLAYANDGEKDFSFEIKAAIIEQTTDEGEKRRVVDPNPENSISKYLESNYGQVLKACIDHPEITIKVAKGKVIYCGTATRDAMLKGNKAEFLKKEFSLDKEAPYTVQNLGYKDIIVGVRDDEELDSKYAVFISSIKPYDEPESAKDLLS